MITYVDVLSVDVLSVDVLSVDVLSVDVLVWGSVRVTSFQSDHLFVQSHPVTQFLLKTYNIKNCHKIPNTPTCIKAILVFPLVLLCICGINLN
jgi:hypothetical protein